MNKILAEILPLPLESERLILRELRNDDIEQVRVWRNQLEIRTWFLHDDIISMEQQQEWYKRYREKPDDLMVMVEIKDTGTPIGSIALYNTDMERHRSEIGRIMIGNLEYTGKGYAREAMQCIIDAVFTHTPLEEIYLEVKGDNDSAIHLYKRCSFITTGKMFKKGIPLLVMSLCKNRL